MRSIYELQLKLHRHLQKPNKYTNKTGNTKEITDVKEQVRLTNVITFEVVNTSWT